ncbi:uncharacterized protein LY89DRAFT_576892 [Mollisia scopiformis]|uniref:DUF7730 domain-containing protein n=1 Tax=Mollisia scopiformis TaxID=149040 RepID=A0A194XPM7_MOLSC|nr:uncharacterized protein LY89DRAFT_576892 [Mollisia scopiformis]KUJ22029.1 hypothetical protein LY89DRAFT_576892 [Mollisia scopiformis]
MSSYRRRHHPHPASPARTASNYQPPPLVQSLTRRSGCITPPSLVPQELDQIKSPLFKLPEEILLLIYEQVIGNNVLHIVRRANHLGHATCSNKSSGSHDDCQDLKCRGTKLPNGVSVQDGHGRDSFIPLLQTCRKIYVDAINVLYTSNTFDFDCMESLISFSTCIVPHRFDCIQNVQLDLRFNYSHFFSEGTPSNDYSRWERMWRIIGSMKSLQHLWCRIVWWRTDLTGAEEARYLGELLQVGKLRVFEVTLPALKWNDPKDKELQGTFEVIRRQSSK